MGDLSQAIFTERTPADFKKWRTAFLLNMLEMAGCGEGRYTAEDYSAVQKTVASADAAQVVL